MPRRRRHSTDELSRDALASRRAEAQWRAYWRLGSGARHNNALADRIRAGAPFLFRLPDGREFLLDERNRAREVYEGRPLRPVTDGDSDLRFVDTGEQVPDEVIWHGEVHKVMFL